MPTKRIIEIDIETPAKSELLSTTPPISQELSHSKKSSYLPNHSAKNEKSSDSHSQSVTSTRNDLSYNDQNSSSNSSQMKNNHENESQSNEQNYAEHYDDYVESIIGMKDGDIQHQVTNITPEFQKFLATPSERKTKMLEDVDILLAQLQIECLEEIPPYDEQYVQNNLGFTIQFDKLQSNDTNTSFNNRTCDNSTITGLNQSRYSELKSTCNNTTFTSNNQSVSLLSHTHNNDEENESIHCYQQTAYRSPGAPSCFMDITNRSIKEQKVMTSLNTKKKQDRFNIESINQSLDELAIQDDMNNTSMLEDHDESSIEYFRADNEKSFRRDKGFTSPITNSTHQNQSNNKRMASTSGKKGLDARRVKTSSKECLLSTPLNTIQGDRNHYNSVDFHQDGCSEIILSPSEMQDRTSDEFQSQIPFLDTQSPIEKHNSTRIDIASPLLFTSSPIQSQFRDHTRRALSFRNCETIAKKKRSNDIQSSFKSSDNDSIEMSMSQRNLRKRSAFEVSHQLRAGAAFRMEPLKVRHQSHLKNLIRKNRKQTAGKSAKVSTKDMNRSISKTFPDPFSEFSDRISFKMQKIIFWMRNQETRTIQSQKRNTNASDDSNSIALEKIETSKKGIILGLNQVQIQAVVLKFLQLSSPIFTSNESMTSRSHGGILLIHRNKDELKDWERYFREKSSFSVLNHASLSAAERKRGPSSRFAGFDIVLTVYDTIKAKEQIQSLNVMGHAQIDANDEKRKNDGWYFSRHDAESQTCTKQLSLLHGMIWRKIIFIDHLGRGCYLSKGSTARMASSKALNGISRYDNM